MNRLPRSVLVAVLLIAGCGDDGDPPGSADAGADMGSADAGGSDAGRVEDGGAMTDGGPPAMVDADVDAGESDAGESDAGESDAGERDAGSAEDGGTMIDGGEADAGGDDAGEADAGCSDRDGDGVCDVADGCPDEATLRAPTGCGCNPALRAGFFVDATRTLGSTNPGTRKVLLGDLDGDSDLDAFLVKAFQPDEVWFNDGAATFTDSTARLGTFVDSAGVLADFDRDGDLDVFTGAQNRTVADSRLYLNDGMGTFSDSGVRIGTGNFVAMASGDFNGDTWVDVAVTNFSSSRQTYAYLNNGSGTAFAGTTFGTAATWGVDIGDVNGDAHDDIVFGLNGASNVVQLGDGMGGFTAGTSFGDPAVNTFSIALGDFDGDGDLDAAVGRGAGTPSQIFWNDGAGGLTDSGQMLSASQAEFGRAVDIDVDGDLDVVFSDMQGAPNGGAHISVNDGTGLFAFRQQIAEGVASRGFGVGDLNGDGLPDLVVGSEGGENPIWLNSCAEP